MFFNFLGGGQPAEVKLPDGQRLAYRMDYVLKETGNTYIQAITSHTAYWCNPDMAFFMLTKIHPELEKFAVEKDPKKTQIPTVVPAATALPASYPPQQQQQQTTAQQQYNGAQSMAHNHIQQQIYQQQQQQQQAQQQLQQPYGATVASAAATQQFNQAYNMQQQQM